MRLIMRPLRPEIPGEIDDYAHAMATGLFQRPANQSVFLNLLIGESHDARRKAFKEDILKELATKTDSKAYVVVDLDASPSSSDGKGRGKIVSGIQITIYNWSVPKMYKPWIIDPQHLKEMENGQAKYDAAVKIARAYSWVASYVKRGYPNVPNTIDEGYINSHVNDPDPLDYEDQNPSDPPKRCGEPHIAVDVLFTLQEYRKCGAASALTRWSTTIADSLNLAMWVTASKFGTPIYRNLGFKDAADISFGTKEFPVFNTMLRRPAKLSPEEEETPITRIAV